MAEPTLLQQARSYLDASSAAPATVDSAVQIAFLRNALDFLLQYAETRERNMSGPAQVPVASTLQRYTSGPAQVPGEPRCEVCGLPKHDYPLAGDLNSRQHVPLHVYKPAPAQVPRMRISPITYSQARDLVRASAEDSGVPVPATIDARYVALQPGQSMSLKPREDGGGPRSVKNLSAQVLYVNVEDDTVSAPAAPMPYAGPAQVPSKTSATTSSACFGPALCRACFEEHAVVATFELCCQRCGRPAAEVATSATTMPDDDLAELQRLCDAATPGPWTVDRENVECPLGTVAECTDSMTAPQPEACFIAAARDALPKLIARVRELQAHVENADALREYADARCAILAERLKEVEHA